MNPSSKVVVIGAGLAGLVAAFTAAQEGADVVLVARGPIGTGTNSALANGYFSGPSESYPRETYIRDTLKTGRFINNAFRVDLTAREAGRAFEFIHFLGLRTRSVTAGRFVESPVSGVIPGVTLMKRLAELISRHDRIHVTRGFYVTDVMVENDRVLGIRGISKTGGETFISAPSAVLAPGGAGAIYLRNDNQKKTLGQGYYLAAKAGLPLRDMEFVQFFPLVLAEPHLPQFILFPPYPREAKLINASGEDVMSKLDLGDINNAIMTRRDAFSAGLHAEIKSSRVYMDFRDLPGHLWDVHPFSVLKKMKFDFRSRPVAVAPAAHFFMGGIEADEQGRTGIDGLLACGEILWGLHGANRMGGNALTECIVTGALAGRQAARNERIAPAVPLPREASTGRPASAHSPAKEVLKGVLRRIKEISFSHAGVVRSEEMIREGLSLVEAMKLQLKNLVLVDSGDRILHEDVASALFVLHAVLAASQGRQESRGSFIRADFPEEDPARWRKNSCLHYDLKEERFSIEYAAPREDSFFIH